MNEHVAWQPLDQPKEGTCETCRFLDRTVGILTAPMQFRCALTGEAHVESHECDVPNFIEFLKQTKAGEG